MPPWVPMMMMHEPGAGFEVADGEQPGARVYITTDDEQQAELFARRLSWQGTRHFMARDGIPYRRFINGQPEDPPGA